jgi:hypothetical protein
MSDCPALRAIQEELEEVAKVSNQIVPACKEFPFSEERRSLADSPDLFREGEEDPTVSFGALFATMYHLETMIEAMDFCKESIRKSKENAMELHVGKMLHHLVQSEGGDGSALTHQEYKKVFAETYSCIPIQETLHERMNHMTDLTHLEKIATAWRCVFLRLVNEVAKAKHKAGSPLFSIYTHLSYDETEWEFEMEFGSEDTEERQVEYVSIPIIIS